MVRLCWAGKSSGWDPHGPFCGYRIGTTASFAPVVINILGKSLRFPSFPNMFSLFCHIFLRMPCAKNDPKDNKCLRSNHRFLFFLVVLHGLQNKCFASCLGHFQLDMLTAKGRSGQHLDVQMHCSKVANRRNERHKKTNMKPGEKVPRRCVCPYCATTVPSHPSHPLPQQQDH